jgi:hypothetical protein
MPVRETGLRRVAAVTTGLAAAAVAGSLAVAGLAWDHSTASTGTTTTGTDDSTTSTTTGTGPAVSTGTGTPHATSGGS